MCHSQKNGIDRVKHLTLGIHDCRITTDDSKPINKGICHVGSSVMMKPHILNGLNPIICWHRIPRSESEKFLRLNAQSSPLFLTRTYENDCICFNTWMSVVLMRETVISVSRVASLLCCCLLHMYVTYLASFEINQRSFPHKCCCDSPSPADTNGTTGTGNQSRANPSSSTPNGGNANDGGSNGDSERNPSGGDGGRDGGSNSGGGDDGGKDDDRNSDSNFESDGGEDDVEERDDEDDDKGNDTQEEDIDQDAAKENAEPPSQLSLVPESVIEMAGGMDAIDDDKAKLLVRRVQPIYELVDSEQSYSKKLTFVKEKYIPCANEDSQIEIPDDLAPRWRILWGNWIQLYEWHTNFLSKLEGIYQTDPDRIPKLFIDSRARLRSIYSKYCENQRKATLIADQYRDFFDDLRVKVGDKEDVQSHLMQPVQRIMRYQLPMGEIVKLTQRANLSSASQWQKALDLMKEIPKDTQMILEAARIDGFTGTITALGNMRIRGDLQVATISRSEFHTRRQTSVRKEKSSAAHVSGNGPEGNSGLELKFSERRVFLFEQMLLITEEVKPKRKDAFAQSTYLFKNAVNVNRMRFEPHWLPPEADIDPDDDDLKFVVEDTSPHGDAAYVLDPGSVEVREQWVIQLRDLQRMQQQLLLALQDPKRYVGGGSGPDADDTATGEATPSPTSGMGAVSGLRSFLSGDRSANKKHGSSKSGTGKKKKFPSFKKGKQRSKTEELPITVQSPGSSGAPVEGGLEVTNKNTRKESCPNTLHLSVLITSGEKKQVDSRKGTAGSDVQHQASAGALISGRASADLQQANDGGADGDAIDASPGGTCSQHSHQPSKKKFSVFNLFGKNKHHHHHHHTQPGTKDQPAGNSPTASVPPAAMCTSDDLSPGAAGGK